MKQILSACFQFLLVAVACMVLWHLGSRILFKNTSSIPHKNSPQFITILDGKLIIPTNNCKYTSSADITLIEHNWYWIIETINSSSCILGQYRLIQHHPNMLIFDAKKTKSQSRMEQFVKHHGGNICALVLEKINTSAYAKLQICKEWLEI